MMKIKKNFLILSIVAVVMLSISGLIIYCYWFFSTRFELINNKFEIIDKRISISDNRFLWDTGASGTILFSNIKIDRIPIGLSFVWDTHYKLKICKLFFVKEYLDDSIRFENLIYTEVKENNVSIAEQKQNFGGILGMNVIKNYNWLLDFSNNTLNNFNISYKYDNLAIFKLEYKSKHKPCTSLDIEGIKLKNTLIDSGSDADIQLLPTDIEQINKIIPPDSIIEQFSSGLFSDSIPSKKYFYSRLKVNGLFIDTLTINESKKRKLGIGFFRKFDRVFWDSGSKEVRFYRD